MKKILSSLLCFFFITAFAVAQSDKPQRQTSKGDDYFQGYEYNDQKADKKMKQNKVQRSSIKAYYDRKIVEYEQRMKDNAERYAEMAKEMKKPQYSDPTYFGHKKPPKKRPAGKKKFCKVCEIVH